MKPYRPHFRHRDSGPPRASEPPMDVEQPEQQEEEEGSEGAVRREAEYLRHLTDDHKPVEIHLASGESFRGTIEYYDKRFIRLTREGAPNLFIYKHDIKYLSEV